MDWSNQLVDTDSKKSYSIALSKNCEHEKYSQCSLVLLTLI
jgi:hypothetical protein